MAFGSIMRGTRNAPTQNNNTIPPASSSVSQSLTRDPGLKTNVTASITFVNSSTHQLQAANGTFASFAVGDIILVEGSNLNDGEYLVVGIDATNQSFLTVQNGLHNEGPISATVRTL